MPNQFGTKRLTSSPLQEYLKLQEVNKNRELTRAQKTSKDNPYSDVYEKKGKYYETVADGSGGLMDQELTPAQYQMKLSSNEAGNASRKVMGLNPIEATPRKEEVPEKGTLEKIGEGIGKATDYVKGKVSAYATERKKIKTTPVEVKEVGDGGRQLLQEENPNITGSNIDVAKSGVAGGSVKTDLTKEPKPIIADPETEKAYQKSLKPMQVNKPKVFAGTPETEKAYQKSLKPMQGNKPKVFAGTPETEKAYQQSLTQKGKAPPNLSDRERANIADGSYRKKAEAVDARRNQLQQNIDAQKAKSGQSPDIFSQISQEKTRRAGKAVPRLSLPSKGFEDKMAQKQLADIKTKKKSDLASRQAKEAKSAKDQSFVESAKRSNKKAKDALASYEDDQRIDKLVNDPAYSKERNKSMASANYKKPEPSNTVFSPTIGSFTNRSPVKKSEIQYAGRKKAGTAQKSLVARNRVRKAKKEVFGKFSRDIKTGAKTAFDMYSRIANRKPSKESEQLRKFGSFK